jgi:hypothetical protein
MLKAISTGRFISVSFSTAGQFSFICARAKRFLICYFMPEPVRLLLELHFELKNQENEVLNERSLHPDKELLSLSGLG